MTQKIAVVGCSFTDTWIDEASDNPTYSWLYHAAEDNPDTTFDSYAVGGMGSPYFDMCLKDIIVQGYTHVLLQLTDNERWFCPVATSPQKSLWVREEITSNLIRYAPSFNSVQFTGQTGRYIRKGESQPKAVHGFFMEKIDPKNHWWGPSDLPLHYHELFVNTLDRLYAPHFEKFVYFTFYQSTHNNCGLTKNVFDHMIDKYGYEDFAKKYTTHDKHLNKQGSYLAYHEFIKPNVFDKLL